MNSVLQRVYEIGIIPVIAFNSVDEALPLCKALMAGGLPAAEVTFRTACAEECIKKIIIHAPDKSGGKRRQKVEIFFNFVDDVEIPVLAEPMIAESTLGRRKTA